MDINVLELVGRVGADPEIRQLQNGRVASFRVGTSERYKDRATGEWKNSETEWTTVSTFVETHINLIEQSIRRGTRVWVRGQLKTRKPKGDQDTGRFFTECQVPPFTGIIEVLGSPSGGSGAAQAQRQSREPPPAMDRDEIPF